MKSSISPLLALALSVLAGCTKEVVCASDQVSCGGACAAIASDPASCGACGRACAAGETCSAGVCRCGDGRADCGGACVDLSSDPANCGACGTTCPGAQVCTTSGGATGCAAGCAAGQTSCGRACVDLASDRYDCGACGRSCGTSERCEGGLCLADLYVACWDANDPAVREATLGLDPAGVPLPTDAGPVRFASLGGVLYVANSLSSTITSVAFDPPAVRSTFQGSPYGSAIPVPVPTGAYPDVEFLAADRGLLYVSNAAAGTLVVVDPALGGTIVDQIPLGVQTTDMPNPQGIAFDHGPGYDRSYVALYGMNQVAIVDISLEGACPSSPPCGQVVQRIDVQRLADAGGQAEPSRFAAAGRKLYVTLSNLTAAFPPAAAGNGKLAVIDLDSQALDATPAVDLGPTCMNAADVTALGSLLYATCGMLDFSSSANPKPVIGTSIVPVDVSGTAPQVGLPIAVPAPVAPGRLAFCGGAGYAGDRNTPTVLRLDPASRAVTTSTTICPASAAFAADVTCAP